MGLKYNIYHNGYTWSSTDKVGSVVISNGPSTSTITSPGDYVLHCAGKVAGNNITIGAKTLNCNGKIMTGNITVNVQQSGMFVTALNNGVIKYSEDGITWYDATGSTVGSDYCKPAAGSTGFIVVNNNGYVCYSNDGKTWTNCGQVSDRQHLPYPMYAEGKFVVKSSYSYDGINWFKSETSYPSTSNINEPPDFYANGKFIIMNMFGYGITSDDGISWSKFDLNEFDANERVRPYSFINGRMAYGNGKYVLIGVNHGYYSTDGYSWKMCGTNYTKSNYGLVYGNGRFVSMGRSPKYSNDGISWESCKGNGLDNDVAYYNNAYPIYANNMFVCIHALGQSTYSYDGITWTNGTNLSTNMRGCDICYGNGRFVAISVENNYYHGGTFYSNDGINWVRGSSGPYGYQVPVLYADGKFISRSSSKLYYSNDGMTWNVCLGSNNTTNNSYFCYG